MATPLGSTPGIIVGVGVGAAASAALAPAIELPKQKAWQDNPNRELDPATLARLVAQGGITLEAAHDGAMRDGYGTDKTDALVYLSQTVPPVAEALTLWRRGLISDDLWRHVLVKSGLDSRYVEPLSSLKLTEHLSPQVIALAIVRGIMDDPGFLPVSPPSGRGVVDPFPHSNIDTLKEAEASGWDRDRLFVQTAISGRPMGPEAAASATFRQIIERIDYDRAISEGDVRNEWADAIFETSRQIATADDYVQAHLRGWITEAEMYDGAARHGVSRADTHLMFLRSGRPAAPTQMWNGWAREVDGPDGRPMDEAQFLKGIAESNIRPEWGPMLWGIRYTYPSLFQMRQLVQSGTLDRPTALDILHKQRYPDDLAVKMVDGWQRSGGASARQLTAAQLTAEYDGLYITRDEYVAELEALGYQAAEAQQYAHLSDARRVAKARDAVVKRIHDSYVGHSIQRAEAETYLSDEQLPADAIALLLSEWDHEVAVTRKTLTPAQIQRAYRRSVLTRAEAIAELADHGYNATDAATLLDSGTAAPPQAPIP